MSTQPTQQPQCGTGPCQQIVDRLSEQMSKQQQAGISAIKELMVAHHGEIKEDIRDIFPRLQKVEASIAEIKTEIGQDGLAAKIGKAVAENNDVKFVNTARPWAAGIAAALVVAFVLYAAGVFDKASHAVDRSTVEIKAKG